MFENINRKELESKLDNDEDFKLIEVLEQEEYREGHIEGSINIPLSDIGKEAKESFADDEEIVVYCANTDCDASPAAAEKLSELGFENVYDYVEGKKGWVEGGNSLVSGNDPS